MSSLVWIALLILLITSLGLLLARDWRVNLGFLAAQYIGVFWLVSLQWPPGMAAVKLVAGWMSTAALGMTRQNLSDEDASREQVWPQGRLFRVFLSGIVLLIVGAAAPRVDAIMGGAGMPVTTGGLLLIGMGLLQLGISGQILRIVVGLMTILAGFEILYAVVEGSILVAALLVIINLGLALAGSYLLIASYAQENEAP